ncbi:hypothetical protein KQ945_03675 [Bacillus subtilis subsp. subtilis]|nr:hypothetical protein [Bacillus subtilis subsp. subtilis]
MPHMPREVGRVRPRVFALVTVLTVHALVGWLLLTPPRPLAGGGDPGLEVRWLPRLLPPADPLPAPVSAALPASRTRAMPPPVASAPPVEAVALPSASIDSAPLDLRLPPGAAAGDVLDARTFTAPIIGQRAVHAAFAPPAKRFRMKRGITPEQMVQGIAQALQMWPPGYVVDLCRLSTAQVDYFQNAVDERDRDLLRQALVRRRQDC